MSTMNKIEYIELQNKVKQIEELANVVDNTFKKMDNLINNNVNSGKGVWDGEEASNFKNEWINLKDNIPTIISVFKKQADNINKVLEITNIK